MKIENTRRNFLKIAPAATVSALLVTDAAAAPGAVSPELADLIARYCEMNDRENEAGDKIADIEDSDEYHKRGAIRLVEVVECVSDYPPRLLHVPIYTESALKEFFKAVNGVIQTVKMDSNPLYGISDEEAKILINRRSDFERAAALLKQREAERKEWLRSIGWEDLNKIWDDEDGIRHATREELLEFQCRSYADVLAKAEFAIERLAGEVTPERIFTLIKSMIPPRPESQPLHA